jgi:glutamate racemase
MRLGERATIGVFDSGVGGLTVLHRLLRAIPGADYHYVGDTARAPYGSRSAGTIINYTEESLRYLESFGCDLIVVACNTASAVALPRLEVDFGVPLIGVIGPGVTCAHQRGSEGILVLATRATIDSGVYQESLRALKPDRRVLGLACPLFVGIAEEGWAASSVAEVVAQRYLSGVDITGIDVALLACTHFPLLLPSLRRVLPPRVEIVDPGGQIVALVSSRLGQSGRVGTPKVHAHLSDSSPGFRQVARLMGLDFSGELSSVDLAQRPFRPA